MTTISPRVTNDVAERISLENLLNLKDRSDKFISNIFRHRIDTLSNHPRCCHFSARIHLAPDGGTTCHGEMMIENRREGETVGTNTAVSGLDGEGPLSLSLSLFPVTQIRTNTRQKVEERKEERRRKEGREEETDYVGESRHE